MQIRCKIILSFTLMFSILFCNKAIAFANGDEITNSNAYGADVIRKTDEFMIKQIADNAPGAAVVIVKDGEVIFSRGYGYADLVNSIPVDVEKTVFEYRSISKLLTWISYQPAIKSLAYYCKEWYN